MEIFIERNKVSINDIKDNKSNLLIFGLFLIGLMVIFSYGVGNVSAANTVYVNATGGNDAWDGSSPVHTTGNIGPNADISTGITHLNSGGTLKIAKGLYTGTKNYGIFINKNMNITGQSKTNTIINAANKKWIFVIQPGSTVFMSNLKLTLGKTNGIGGAIINKGNLTVTNCNFDNNAANTNGGAIYNIGNLLAVSNCNFYNNTANNGGAIHTQGGIVKINNSTFTGNNAGIYGGAIYNHSTLTLKGCTFKANISGIGFGGAIENDGSLTISNSVFNHNTVGGDGVGGAIHTKSFLGVTNSTFVGNSASAGGAIADEESPTLIIKGSNFISNSARFGGAIYNQGNVIIHFSRIVGNTAKVSGSAIYNEVADEFITPKLNATLNWWGTNNGTKIAKLISNIPTYSSSVYNPWIVLTIHANPATVNIGDTSTITTSLLFSNNGAYHSPVYGVVPYIGSAHVRTTKGTIINKNFINGKATSILKNLTTTGLATVYATVDGQTVNKSVMVMNLIFPPKIVLTSPKNGATGFSRTAVIAIKFSENIKSSINWSKIELSNSGGHHVVITRSIAGNTIIIKAKSKRTTNSWYVVTIPASAVKDYSGNNLTANYAFRFKTGA